MITTSTSEGDDFLASHLHLQGGEVKDYEEKKGKVTFKAVFGDREWEVIVDDRAVCASIKAGKETREVKEWAKQTAKLLTKLNNEGIWASKAVFREKRGEITGSVSFDGDAYKLKDLTKINTVLRELEEKIDAIEAKCHQVNTLAAEIEKISSLIPTLEKGLHLIKDPARNARSNKNIEVLKGQLEELTQKEAKWIEEVETMTSELIVLKGKFEALEKKPSTKLMSLISKLVHPSHTTIKNLTW